MNATQGKSDEALTETRSEAITLKVTASEKRALFLVAAARDTESPPTLLREFSLRDVVAEAERLKGELRAAA